MIRKRKKKKGKKMIKKIILLIVVTVFYANFSYAEKIECDLLSPIQKKIYSAYCKAEAKKMGKTSVATDKSNKELGKVSSFFKKLKIPVNVNTDSKLFKTGKYSTK